MGEKGKALVSVIVPCYNQAIYLSDALESLLQQTYQNWEAIVVNDGSSDNTEGIALEYAKKYPKIKYVAKENGGLSSARNKGIECAKGEYILPLDADDMLKPEYMEKAMDAFEKSPQLKLVYCQGLFFGAKTGLWENLHYSGYKNQLLWNSIFCSAFYKKSDWEKVGGYDENMRKGHEDWEFFIRLLNGEGLVCQIQAPLFCYRIKDVSMITMATKKEIMAETALYIYSKNRAIYASYFGDNILELLYELNGFRERKKRHRNKWYRKFYYKYLKTLFK